MEDKLTALEGPYEDAFCTEIEKWLKKSEQTIPYDLTDAAHYLNRWIRNNGNRPVPWRIVQQWAETCNTTMDKGRLLSDFNREYRRVYGTDGVAP